MTYTITRACVDIKDKACIEECPVDCIYEGERMLYIHPIDAWTVAPASRCARWRRSTTRTTSDPEVAGAHAIRPAFEELGSPGGASKVGMTANDPQVVKDLPPKGEDD